MIEQKWKNGKELLIHLNERYLKVHTAYEKLFWMWAMGDHAISEKKDKAEKQLESFKTNEELKKSVEFWIPKSSAVIRSRLAYWSDYFSRNQTPSTVKHIRDEIFNLQTLINTKRASVQEGYTDPHTNKFVKVSRNGMQSLMRTHDDEKVRKACFDALEQLALSCIDEYVILVQKRNEFARGLGYSDYYAYKLFVEEKMTKKELFSLWDTIYDKTKYAFADIRKLENEQPGLRKPWNFSYMLASSFVKEADPYFPFENAVPIWLETFGRLGINFRGGTMMLDLLDRKGKYNNGFCQWPLPVHYKSGRRIPAFANFTCTVVQGIPGESFEGLNTLFHEGGHAAHYLNCDNKDICLNIEYPPASTAWAETQSMFLDTICSSIEWRTRYSKNLEGKLYPFDLFERQTRTLHLLRPLGLMGILMVTNFEKEIYEQKSLSKEKVIAIAKKAYKKYTDKDTESLTLLDVPHIYSADSACSYHGYGLAELALSQWREYFFSKYGYIVDNPNIGKEMRRVWKYGSAKSFPELVKIATERKLSPNAYIKNVTKPLKQVIATAQQRINALKNVKQKPVTESMLDAHISLVHGKKEIANSKRGFVVMTRKYTAWLKTQYEK